MKFIISYGAHESHERGGFERETVIRQACGVGGLQGLKDGRKSSLDANSVKSQRYIADL
jgi:hypothetical protein